MIIVRIWEGLGNQMFQYAYARALHEKGINVRLDMDKAYDKVFQKNRKHTARQNSIQNYRLSLKEIDVYKYGKYSYLMQDSVYDRIVFWLGSHSLWKYKFYEEKDALYSEKSSKIRGNYYIKGWFQCEKYFRNIRSILLREFRPKKKIFLAEDVRTALKDPQTVSIHIRRNDYIKENNALNLTYYKKAVDYIKKYYDNPVFLVFSDDLPWVKENFMAEGSILYVNEDRKLQDYEELMIMSRCKSNIIANSTFSWWGAWLNTNKDKHVIAPKMWFPGHQDDIIPEGWITI